MGFPSKKTKIALTSAFALISLACSGSVRTLDADEEESEPPATGGSTGGSFATGGEPGEGTGGTSEPYVEPECPEEPPPPVEQECDPLDPLVGCDEGFGCYPYLEYPFGKGCGHPTFGAVCAAASTGEQGEFCGDGAGYCAPGFMCVVGAAGGKRCGKICATVADHGCPPGLICGETDIQGYGVCF